MYTTAVCFFIYAMLGWCVEVVYATVNSGKFVNRGFLNGPYCPIYGCGVLIVTGLLMPVQENLPALFFGSVLLTTALELATGFLLARIFNEHWWDYSEEPFNLGGYICLKFSLLWGIACVLVVRVIHPLVLRFVGWLPHTLGVILLIALGIGFCADLTVTIMAILKIKKRIRLLSSITRELRNISDQLGENLSDSVTDAMELRDKSRQEFALGRELTQIELNDLRNKGKALSDRYHAILEQRGIIQKRIRRAYPSLTGQLRARLEAMKRGD